MVVIENEKEEIVISWLKSHGYYRVVIEPNHAGIEADGKMRKMMVAVRTPETQSQEVDQFKAFAHTKNREPWLAVVESDNDIMWFAV